MLTPVTAKAWRSYADEHTGFPLARYWVCLSYCMRVLAMLCSLRNMVPLL